MARVVTKMAMGTSSIDRIVEFASEIPTRVIDRMLTAEADIIEPKIEAGARTMLRRKYYTGTTAKSIYRKPPHNYKKNGQRQITLTFRGTRPNGKKRKRNAEVAFVNEYGAKNTWSGKKLQARPFVQRGIEAGNYAATKQAEQIFCSGFSYGVLG